MKFNIQGFLTALIILCIEGMILTWIWNALPLDFHLPTITFGQGIGMLWGIRLVLRPLWSNTNEMLGALKRIENMLFFQIQIEIESVKYTKHAEVEKKDKSLDV